MHPVEWKEGYVVIADPRHDGNLHGPDLTIDLQEGRMRWIVKIQSVDGEPFSHGEKVSVRYTFLDDFPPPPRSQYELYVASKLFGYLHPTASQD